METTILLNTIKNISEDMDIELNERQVQKGNETLVGISIGDESIRPVFYIKNYEDLFEKEGYEAVARKILSDYEQIKPLNVNANEITTWDYAKEHLLLCIAPAGIYSNTVTIPYLDLELYFRVVLSEGSYKVNEQMLTMWDITKESLLEIAFHSNKFVSSSMQDTIIESMKECGMPDDQIEKMIREMQADNNIDQTVISTSNNLFGASALFYLDVLKKVADRYESDLYIIPSSIHELITLPTDGFSVEDMNNMIKETNESQVAPEERLSNHTYIFHRDTMEIDW